MCVYLCIKVQVSSIILTSFRQGRGNCISKSKPKKPTQSSVKKIQKMWRVKQMFFPIEKVREIILEFSKGKAEILVKLC